MSKRPARAARRKEYTAAMSAPPGVSLRHLVGEVMGDLEATSDALATGSRRARVAKHQSHRLASRAKALVLELRKYQVHHEPAARLTRLQHLLALQATFAGALAHLSDLSEPDDGIRKLDQCAARHRFADINLNVDEVARALHIPMNESAEDRMDQDAHDIKKDGADALPKHEWLLRPKDVAYDKDAAALGENPDTGLHVRAGELAGGVAVAVKQLALHDVDGDSFAAHVRRAHLLRHPNLVRVLGGWKDPVPALVMKRFPCDSLWSLMNSQGKDQALPMHQILQIALDVAHGLAYLTSRAPRPWVHGSVKPSNVLIDRSDGTAILTDFAVQHVSKTSAARSDIVYQPPERMDTRNAHPAAMTPAGDVYAFAMLLYVMLTGSQPMAGIPPLDVPKAVRSGTRPALPDTAPGLARLISACWHADAKARPSFAQVIAHLASLQHEQHQHREVALFSSKTLSLLHERIQARDRRTSRAATPSSRRASPSKASPGVAAPAAGAATSARLPSQPLHKLECTTGWFCESLRPLTSTLVLASQTDGVVQVWDWQNGKPRGQLHGHEGAVYAAIDLHDGRHAATCSADGSIKTWFRQAMRGSDVDIWRCDSTTIDAHDGKPIEDMAPVPGKKRVVTVGADGTTRLWNTTRASSDTRPMQLHSVLSRDPRPMTSIAVTKDGNQAVAAGSGKLVKVWDLGSGKELHTLTHMQSEVTDVCDVGDAKHFVGCGSDGSIMLWDLRSGKLVTAMSGHKSVVDCVAALGDGLHIASGSLDHTLCLWDLRAPGKPVNRLTQHRDVVTAVTGLRDSHHLMSSDAGGELIVWA